jgi:hypothetical protein
MDDVVDFLMDAFGSIFIDAIYNRFGAKGCIILVLGVVVVVGVPIAIILR